MIHNIARFVCRYTFFNRLEKSHFLGDIGTQSFFDDPRTITPDRSR